MPGFDAPPTSTGGAEGQRAGQAAVGVGLAAGGRAVGGLADVDGGGVVEHEVGVHWPPGGDRLHAGMDRRGGRRRPGGTRPWPTPAGRRHHGRGTRSGRYARTDEHGGKVRIRRMPSLPEDAESSGGVVTARRVSSARMGPLRRIGGQGVEAAVDVDDLAGRGREPVRQQGHAGPGHRRRRRGCPSPAGPARPTSSSICSKPGMPLAATVRSGPAATRLTRIRSRPRSRAR